MYAKVSHFYGNLQTERLMLIEELKWEQKYAHCYRE